MYFYELHEGDDEIFSDLLLVHDDLMEPDDFYELVQAIRTRVQDTFEDDTLIEAIAHELERDHGFTFIDDSRLTASVHVSEDEDENRLIDLDDEGEDADDFRTILADFDPDARLN